MICDWKTGSIDFSYWPDLFDVSGEDARPTALRREKTFDLSENNSGHQLQQHKSKAAAFTQQQYSKLIDIQLDTER